jgi:hypothetical protein
MQELLPRSKAETHRTPAIMMGFHSVTTHPTVFCRVPRRFILTDKIHLCMSTFALPIPWIKYEFVHIAAKRR